MPISKDIAIVIRAFDRTAGGTTKTTSNMKKVATVAKAASVAIAAMGAVAAAAAVRMGKAFIDTADQTSKMGRRLGISTEQLSTLRHAAELTGVEMSTLSTGLQRMTRRVAEAANGSGEAKDAIKELGLSAQALAQLSPDEQFREIADAMKDVSNQGDRVRLAMKLFDTEGVALIQTMEGGADGIRAMQEEARKLGLEISTNTGKEAEAFNDNLLRLKRQVSGLVASLATAALPTMNSVAEVLRKMFEEGDLARNVFSLLTGVLQEVSVAAVWAEQTVGALGTALGVVLNNLSEGKDVSEAWEGAMNSINVSTDNAKRKVEELRAAFRSAAAPRLEINREVSGGDAEVPFQAELDALDSGLSVATSRVQSFQGMASSAFVSVANGIGQAALNAENMSQALTDVGKSIAQMFINYIAQRLAMFAVEKTLAGVGLAAAGATATGMSLFGAEVAAAWLPAATFVSLATFGANVGPAIGGMTTAFAAAVGLGAGSSFLGGLLQTGAGIGGGLAGQAHAGLDMVPREGTYLLDRGEAVLQPEANQDLRRMADDYNGRGGMTMVNVMLDGEVLAKAMGKMSRNGILQIHAKSVV